MSDPTADAPRQQRLAGRPHNARIQAPRLSAREEAEAGAAVGDVGFDGQQRLVRRRRRVDDKFFMDRSKIPDGWSYEWKRQKVYGMTDVDHQVNLRENMWQPVPSSRHPEMMPTGHDGPIEKDGMVLMERPQYLTEEARQEDYEIAMDQVRVKEQQLGHTPGGQFTRDHPSVHRIAKIKRSYGPVDAES